MSNQLELHKRIVELSGVNVVNCGNCGDVFYHTVGDKEICCPYCDHKGEPCEFPDFQY